MAKSKPPNHESLEEMVRAQERVIEHQAHALEEQDGKSEHMIRLSIAALAGAVALASLLLRGPEAIPTTSLLPLGIAAGLNLVALILFVDAYVGFRRHPETYIGPDPSWIANRALEAEWPHEKYLSALLQAYPGFFRHNSLVAERTTQRRRAGVYNLLASLLIYAGGYIYILWEVIVA